MRYQVTQNLLILRIPNSDQTASITYQEFRERVNNTEVINNDIVWFRLNDTDLWLVNSKGPNESILPRHYQSNIMLFADLA